MLSQYGGRWGNRARVCTARAHLSAMSGSRRGRPMVYAKLILSLADDELWSNHRIAEYAITLDTFEPSQRAAISNAMRHFSIRKLPDARDGTCYARGYYRDAWYGWRWKLALAEYYGTPEQRKHWKSFRAADMAKRAPISNQPGYRRYSRLLLILALIFFGIIMWVICPC